MAILYNLIYLTIGFLLGTVFTNNSFWQLIFFYTDDHDEEWAKNVICELQQMQQYPERFLNSEIERKRQESIIAKKILKKAEKKQQKEHLKTSKRNGNGRVNGKILTITREKEFCNPILDLQSSFFIQESSLQLFAKPNFNE